MEAPCGDPPMPSVRTDGERLAHTVVQKLKENLFRFEPSVNFLSNGCDEEVTRPRCSQSTDTGELWWSPVGEELH
jgi:hypothetical protein